MPAHQQELRTVMLKKSEGNEQKWLEWEILCSGEKNPAPQTDRMEEFKIL